MKINPKLYPAIAKVLAAGESGDKIWMDKDEFKKEHEHLLDVLDNPTPEALRREHDDQKKEAQELHVDIKHADKK